MISQLMKLLCMMLHMLQLKVINELLLANFLVNPMLLNTQINPSCDHVMYHIFARITADKP
jgi:hypothetical protein